MKIRCVLSIIILLISFIDFCSAQVPSVPVPQLGLPNTPPIRTSPNNSNNPTVINHGFNQQAQQVAIFQEVQAHQRQQQEVANNEVKKKDQVERQRQYDIQMLSTYGFPMQSGDEGTSAFYSAYDEINSMLNSKDSLNLGRAVFLVENAWYNNKYDYNDYQKAIKASIDFCNRKIQDEKLDKNDNLVKNMMLFRYISDTLQIKGNGSKNQIHYPIKYNYDDYDSQTSYDSHFVTTLMQTGVGQCHSMPLYYLVLAEEIGAEAYWAFSPRHSFVKIQDRRGNWHNLELTCKAILSDAHYMNNSYIKAEAIRNRIYLEPLNKTNTIAQMLVELARGYYKKYGMDDFFLKCVNTALEYSSNNVDALNLKANYETRLTLTLANLLNAPKPDDMKAKSPEAYKHYEAMQALYKQVDDLGYEELPDRVYADWLKHIDREKAKANKLPSIFINVKKE